MKNLLWTIRTTLMLAVGTVSALAVTADYTVQVSAEAQNSPAQIKLSWPQDMYCVPTSYTVYRKAPEATTWNVVITLPGTETSFIDTNVTTQTDYEYQVEKIAVGYSGYGCVLAGIEAPLTEFRGKVILIVDNTYAADLANELALLQQDLAGDGWIVLRHDVLRNDSVISVKTLIQADYFVDTNSVKSVFLFGHVPVPYSGNIVPDGHVPDHQGAWPADVFYGDMNGTWTDSSVSNTFAYNARNWNVPGDGKFDQSIVATGVELAVGRVDLSDLPSFPLSEKELLRQYLNKDHNFRHKLITAERRGLIQDSFATSSGSPFAPSGWRNFAAFFGASNITAIAPATWFSTLSTDSYLWAYGCGGGTFTSADGVGCTADYAANNPKAVFNLLFGSYFGDWDSTDNFMRASLATPDYGLTCGWAGRPHWFLHQMGLGETIGFCARLTQNNGNGGLYKQVNAGSLQVHVALMGDPTLRLHPVAPPSALAATASTGQVALAWSPATETILGYFVYRSTNELGPFTRVTDALVSDPAFTDTGLGAGTYTYMVRAIKLESSASGSYYNASQGAFATATVTQVALSLISAPDLKLELGTAWSFVPPTAGGGCGNVSVSPLLTSTNATCGNSFFAVRVWQATDEVGNTCFATNLVVVGDTTPPTLSMLSSKTVYLGAPWIFDTPTASDAGGNVKVTVLNVVTNLGAGGEYTATCTWQATDPCGNASTCSQTVTVQNPPPTFVSIMAMDANAAEAPLDTGTYVISRTGALSKPLTVKLGYGGTARNGVDYRALPTQVTIPAGANSIALVLVPIMDNLNESTETAVVTIQSSSAYLLGTNFKATVSIQNATPITISVVATDADASEAGPNTGMFVLSRTGDNAAPLTVKLGYSGTARNGVDYLTLPSQVTIPAGVSSLSLQLTPIRDGLDEKSETAVITVQSSSSYLLGTSSKATATLANAQN
ncbi:MAG: HYR domain-containing protein [Verrucomicrobia bacterium]|nr:HYR domain-containing protein [Verrucomicrobiota bacterium]